jgi:hypothetical protein
VRILALATTAVALFALPAHAAPTIVGTSCGLLAAAVPAVEILGGQGTFNGVLVGAAVAVDVSQPTANPAAVHMTCVLKVNGFQVGNASSVVDVGAAPTLGPVIFNADEAALVEVCTTITAASASGTTTYPTTCVEATSATVPPAEVCDLLPPTVCPLLGSNRLLFVIPGPVLV